MADKLKVNQPVIVNLQNVDRDLSRRIIDFASGLCYGVGGQMVSKLISKLSSHRRTSITLEVRETNLAAQLFFKQNGFRATAVLDLAVLASPPWEWQREGMSSSRRSGS